MQVTFLFNAGGKPSTSHEVYFLTAHKKCGDKTVYKLFWGFLKRAFTY